ncbi:MAG: metal-dependent transcriptional regulator [Bacilli bacterium]|nr:metal-dependent transcriptional regulator [Bacilli bacterium]
MKKDNRATEDFLEALLMLELNGEKLETTKVASMLGISKPAVHQMGHQMIDKGFITRVDYGDMKLTDSGREVAEKVYRRHCVLKNYLISIGVSPETAEKDCCLMEHSISDETFSAIEKLTK